MYISPPRPTPAPRRSLAHRHQSRCHSRFFLPMRRPTPTPTLFPYTTLFRSSTYTKLFKSSDGGSSWSPVNVLRIRSILALAVDPQTPTTVYRSEEHTSELQSRGHLVCRLLLEKKNQLP